MFDSMYNFRQNSTRYGILVAPSIQRCLILCIISDRIPPGMEYWWHPRYRDVWFYVWFQTEFRQAWNVGGILDTEMFDSMYDFRQNSARHGILVASSIQNHWYVKIKFLIESHACLYLRLYKTPTREKALSFKRHETCPVYTRREKEGDLTQSYDKTPYTNRKFENQRTTHTYATKNFDYTTIADRLRTVSWSNK